MASSFVADKLSVNAGGHVFMMYGSVGMPAVALVCPSQIELLR